jgi:hypothetical protein
MTQTGARIQGEAEAFGEARRDETEEDRNARVAAEMEERLRDVSQEVAAEHGQQVHTPEER